MIVSITLALVALVVAVLGVSDLKTLRRAQGGEADRPWWLRLTLAGYAKIAFALITFGLIGLKEYQAQERQAAASVRESALAGAVDEANEKLVAQATELEQAHSTLRGLMYESAAHRQSFRMYDLAMRGAHVYLENHRILIDGRISYDIDYEPAGSDRLVWRLSCPGGGLPPRDLCPMGEYGRLLARSTLIPLVDAAGEAVFRGTAQPSGRMHLELGLGPCRPLRRALEENLCELDLNIYRTNEMIQLNLLGQMGDEMWDQRLIGPDTELCRAYEILHDDTCEDYIRREFQ